MVVNPICWIDGSRHLGDEFGGGTKRENPGHRIPDELWHTRSVERTVPARPELIRANGFYSVLTNSAREKDIYDRFGVSADLLRARKGVAGLRFNCLDSGSHYH
jgi:hypothetical protein